MMEFCEKVLSHIPRATKQERKDICSELEDHVADHAAALVELGCSEEEARAKAETAMGDPAEIGRAFNEGLSPFWLWAKRIAQGVVCLLLAASFSIYGSSKMWTGTWEVLASAWDNAQARQGKGLEWVESGVVYPTVKATHAWSCWETMRVRDEMVCLYRVELWPVPDDLEMPGAYCGEFYFCTYNVNLFDPANEELLEQLTITPESGVKDSEYRHSFTRVRRGVWEGRVQRLVIEGDTYVDVTYDYFGTYATMRCPLTWEEVAP